MLFHYQDGTAHRTVATAAHQEVRRLGFYRSVAATHVRGSCRCLRRGRLHRRCDRSLARCGSGRLGFAGTGDQHQGENGKRRTKYDCSFHSMNCFFTRRFVADRIARRIYGEEFFLNLDLCALLL